MSSVRSITLLNADYQPLGMVSFNKAARLLAKNKAVVEVADESKEFLRDWLYPKVIRLIKMAKLSYAKVNGKAILSKRGVLIRDNHKCGYCGRKATTIDHVQPKSRGGQDSWLNLVAACFACNNRKDARTPQEANMKLLITPYVPSKMDQKMKSFT